MTQGDYRKIVTALRLAKAFDEGSFASIVSHLCVVLQADNPRFNEEKFRAALAK